ncbi:hypothetical protein QBC39DRAFT_152800 [Podospora conica]|nr:hypothetical protein QBC39DRAFT_152800 [Schizothecium conicum]
MGEPNQNKNVARTPKPPDDNDTSSSFEETRPTHHQQRETPAGENGRMSDGGFQRSAHHHHHRTPSLSVRTQWHRRCLNLTSSTVTTKNNKRQKKKPAAVAPLSSILPEHTEQYQHGRPESMGGQYLPLLYPPRPSLTLVETFQNLDSTRPPRSQRTHRYKTTNTYTTTNTTNKTYASQRGHHPSSPVKKPNKLPKISNRISELYPPP